MKINIERLMDALEESMVNEQQYTYLGKNRYKLYPDYDKRKQALDVAYHSLNESNYTIIGIVGVLNLENRWKDLYMITRAVRKWREITRYEQLIPESMRDQIGKYLFGDEYETEEERIHKKMLKDWGYI